MCDEAVTHYPCILLFVPDWFVTQELIKVWHDDNDHCGYDVIIKWDNGHQKRKAQKAKIKEKLILIAWHPSRWWDWCVPEDEKKRQKNCESGCFKII